MARKARPSSPGMSTVTLGIFVFCAENYFIPPKESGLCRTKNWHPFANPHKSKVPGKTVKIKTCVPLTEKSEEASPKRPV